MAINHSACHESRGTFISVEGSEGSGKSTNIQFLLECLQERHINVMLTREPGGTQLGEKLREILLAPEQKICDKSELMLMFAARAQHVETVISPALAQGQWVLCDRFTDATYAYQGAGRGINVDTIRSLEQWTLCGFKPDHTFLLDVPIEIGLERVRQRGELDRFEQEKVDFFERVRACYLTLAKQQPNRISIIDASQNLQQVQVQLVNAVDSIVHSAVSLTDTPS